ncbi:MAG: sugar phosphate isomerase/epimerase [Lachnospiraceae bacterium]|nr:sugar phosphate isomerase/epimerase [Lachnospiraceae bacterium]
MKYGCHAVMFAAKLATDMETVTREIGTTGFAGIECGNRFISLENRDRLMDLLRQNGLELAAIHYAFMDWRTDPRAGIEGLKAEAAYMAKTPNKNINMSFMPTPDDDADKLVTTFEEAAKAAAEFGVSLNYHNHLAEFANDGVFVYKLLENAPHLNFAYDLGWVRRAGFDPIKLLKDSEGRCNYVHLRDPKTEKAQAYTLEAMRALPPFPEFGTGETNLQEQIDFLQGYLNEQGWAIVEHEGGEPDINRYIKAKAVLDSLIR